MNDPGHHALGHARTVLAMQCIALFPSMVGVEFELEAGRQPCYSQVLLKMLSVDLVLMRSKRAEIPTGLSIM